MAMHFDFNYTAPGSAYASVMIEYSDSSAPYGVSSRYASIHGYEIDRYGYPTGAGIAEIRDIANMCARRQIEFHEADILARMLRGLVPMMERADRRPTELRDGSPYAVALAAMKSAT